MSSLNVGFECASSLRGVKKSKEKEREAQDGFFGFCLVGVGFFLNSLSHTTRLLSGAHSVECISMLGPLLPSSPQCGRCWVDVTGRESLQDKTQLGKASHSNIQREERRQTVGHGAARTSFPDSVGRLLTQSQWRLVPCFCHS